MIHIKVSNSFFYVLLKTWPVNMIATSEAVDRSVTLDLEYVNYRSII